MVKFRGIDIGIVSQLDCGRLPEFSQAHLFGPFDSTATCHIPMNAGSQIWFEYLVDGPHPPGASYFFKLLMNGQTITSWDCTAKHAYHGKAVFALQPVGKDEFGAPATLRHGFHFSAEGSCQSANWNDDCIEIRVHRIEHRRRIRDCSAVSIAFPEYSKTLRLVDSGLLEPGRPARRYQFQLLDPQDEPYAIFRFYCRSSEYLKKHTTIQLIRSPSISSISPSSSEYFDSPEAQPLGFADPGTPKHIITSPLMLSPDSHHSSIKKDTSLTLYVPLNSSVESLNALTKDSVDDLPSAVPRSPQSGKSPRKRSVADNIPPSPTRSPRRNSEKHKENQAVELGAATLDPAKRRRPLSPFTNGGMLRRFVSTPLPSAPAIVTESRSDVEDEKQEQLHVEEKESRSMKNAEKPNNRAQRGGRALIGLLGLRKDKNATT